MLINQNIDHIQSGMVIWLTALTRKKQSDEQRSNERLVLSFNIQSLLKKIGQNHPRATTSCTKNNREKIIQKYRCLNFREDLSSYECQICEFWFILSFEQKKNPINSINLNLSAKQIEIRALKKPRTPRINGRLL